MRNNLSKALDKLMNVPHTSFQLMKVEHGFLCTLKDGDKKWFAMGENSSAAIAKAVKMVSG